MWGLRKKVARGKSEKTGDKHGLCPKADVALTELFSHVEH